MNSWVIRYSILSTFQGEVYQYLLLTMYDFIFIVPLLVILVAVLSVIEYVSRVKIFRSKNLGTLELISGLLLVLISIYILLT